MPSKSKPPAPVLIFWGTDELAVAEDLARWRDRFAAKQADASIIAVDGERPAGEISAALDAAAGAQSLFSSAKLVIVSHFLAFKDEAAERRLISLLDEARAGETVVFLSLRGSPDRRRTLIKNLLERVKNRRATLIERTAPIKPAERLQWLRHYWSAAGCTYEEAAAAAVELATREQPFSCLRQLAALCLLAGYPRLDRALVASYLPEPTQPLDFALVNALQRHDRASALRELAHFSLNRHEDTAQAIMNFGSVLYFIEKGWRLRALSDEGVPPANQAAAAKVSPYVATRLQESVRRHPAENWRIWWHLAAQLERSAKHGRADFTGALERLVWSITK